MFELLRQSSFLRILVFFRSTICAWCMHCGCTAMTTGASAPRTELIHHLHSPKYYPGNCTQGCWGGRNCPAVITSGDLKLMLGYVGDPRRLPMNESTSGERVPFGATGGKCGLAGFAGKEDSTAFFSVLQCKQQLTEFMRTTSKPSSALVTDPWYV